MLIAFSLGAFFFSLFFGMIFSGSGRLTLKVSGRSKSGAFAESTGRRVMTWVLHRNSRLS